PSRSLCKSSGRSSAGALATRSRSQPASLSRNRELDGASGAGVSVAGSSWGRFGGDDLVTVCLGRSPGALVVSLALPGAALLFEDCPRVDCAFRFTMPGSLTLPCRVAVRSPARLARRRKKRAKQVSTTSPRSEERRVGKE